METLFLDGAEGLVINVFLSHIVYHVLSSEIITNGKTHTQTMIWSPYAEVLNVIAGIRVFYWSKLDLSDKLRIIWQRVIYYQITHFIFLALNTQLPGNVYFPTFSNIFILQCFNKLRYDIYDLSTIYSLVFWNHNVIFLTSRLLRSVNGFMYQIAIISALMVFRFVYVIQRIQADEFSYHPQQFLSQGYQETLSAFLTFFVFSLHEKIPETFKIKLQKFLPLAISLNIYIIFITLKLFCQLSSIEIIKKQWLKFALAFVFLRPIYILATIILFLLVNLSPSIKKILSQPVLSKLFYLPRMYQFFITCIVWKILLGNLSNMQIGPADPVIIVFVVVGFMVVVQFFSVMFFYFITPIIFAILRYFDSFFDDFAMKVQLVVQNYKLGR